MKKRSIKLHLIYWFVIALLIVSIIALFVLMKNQRRELLERSEAASTLDREQLIGSIEAAQGALRMAAHSESPTVYAAKMQQFAEGCAGAALLTQQRDPASAWGIFWTRLSAFAGQEIARTIGEQSVVPDVALLSSYADILARLMEAPEALEGPLWEELPDELKPPELQTEFSLGEDQLKSTAAKHLNIGNGLLKKVDSGMAGIVRYKCANAEIDLLISGQLVYLDLQLPPKEGSIGRTEGIRRLTEFAGAEGFAKAEVIDLYENEGILWAKLVPTVRVTHYGAVKNLDRPIIAACTLWSGRVCHFEVSGIETGGDSLRDEMSVDANTLLSESRMKKLAQTKGATLGEAVLCKGRLCRTLIVDSKADGRSVHIYLDAADGSEREVALRYSPLPEELPASAYRMGDSLPIGREALPPYAEWQRRRYRAAVLDGTL